jgi:hypothetical protein
VHDHGAAAAGSGSSSAAAAGATARARAGALAVAGLDVCYGMGLEALLAALHQGSARASAR